MMGAVAGAGTLAPDPRNVINYAAVFLAVRQARLAALIGSDEVVAAAKDGSAAMLSRPLRRFEALTAALWTVQSDLRPASPPARAPGGTGSRIRTPDRGPAASGS